MAFVNGLPYEELEQHQYKDGTAALETSVWRWGPNGGRFSNLEADKNIYGNGFLTAKVGPFLDTGKISDPIAALGSHEWLWDSWLNHGQG